MSTHLCTVRSVVCVLPNCNCGRTLKGLLDLRHDEVRGRPRPLGECLPDEGRRHGEPEGLVGAGRARPPPLLAALGAAQRLREGLLRALEVFGKDWAAI